MITRLLIVVLLAISITWMPSVAAQDVCNSLDGASIIAQDSDNTFLGKITNSFDSDSIFNEFGTYGNEFSSDSIWNEYSEFGNEFNGESPFNEFSSDPPMIIKDGQVIGYLSTNKSINEAISPNLLKALCADVL
jgi:hypothetical protein